MALYAFFSFRPWSVDRVLRGQRVRVCKAHLESGLPLIALAVARGGAGPRQEGKAGLVVNSTDPWLAPRPFRSI